MNNIIKRIGRDAFEVEYKKQKMLFTSKEAKELETELNSLGI